MKKEMTGEIKIYCKALGAVQPSPGWFDPPAKEWKPQKKSSGYKMQELHKNFKLQMNAWGEHKHREPLYQQPGAPCRRLPTWHTPATVSFLRRKTISLLTPRKDLQRVRTVKYHFPTWGLHMWWYSQGLQMILPTTQICLTLTKAHWISWMLGRHLSRSDLNTSLRCGWLFVMAVKTLRQYGACRCHGLLKVRQIYLINIPIGV